MGERPLVPVPPSLVPVVRILAVRRKVWPHTHYLALKLPVNFNLDGFVREVGGLPGAFQRVDLGGKALLVLIDCHANPKAGPAPAPAPAPAVRCYFCGWDLGGSSTPVMWSLTFTLVC